MRILPLKKCVNRDKCSFATKQRMFDVFVINEPRSPTRALCFTLVNVVISTTKRPKIDDHSAIQQPVTGVDITGVLSALPGVSKRT